ncbi:MAG: hypothetical protein KKE39_10900 [Bacteroidetes bacterium]|nr:hypothetical protein [Bacteroidota bacterium]MBU1371725.1 hypothetical protein [Bacteroidota bacterium]MBU1483730.1 hypothetical protein [Bacteroidota bacterium]MBU1759307.1 hypothetical protein [Bacteroidota bacterium]MBU2045889.1 hypothetical protein [Bacteroidota bacterium]
MKQALLLLFLFIFSFKTFAQQQNIAGLVFDKDTKYRLNRVNILNTRTQEAVFNNTKGEFLIDVKIGDILISYLDGYKRDTLKITNQTALVIYLKRLAIPLPEVIFKDSVLSARDKYEQTKKEFNKAVRLGNNKDILNIGPSGVGLGIDAIWSAFSREGKNARKLMEMMERDYQNAVIDKIFNKELVTRVTGLRGDKLLLFMLNFRPSYAFAVKANEYELVNYIKLANMRFKINPNYEDITRLKPIENY